MSKLSIEITRVDVQQKGNHFIVIQLDEVEYPSNLRRTQKFRTEIEYDSEFPQFFKTFFEFKEVVLGNRIVLRIGLFQTFITNKNENQDIPSNILFENSDLIGANDIPFTPTLIDLLRKHKWVENDIRLKNPEKEKTETGHVYFKLTLKPETLDTKIYENNKEIESLFYDPFENNPDVIREKLKQVIVLNEEKQIKLNKKMKELEEINNKVKRLAMDKNYVLKEIYELEEENNLMRKNISRLQNYDEIHIEIDILSQSSQGIAIIEKKYAILLSQQAIQNQHYYEMEREYEEIDSIMSKIKIVKDKISTLKNANQEVNFNIKRNEDMLPLISTYQERIKNNEKLINNLRENIKEVIKKNSLELEKNYYPGITHEDINEKIKILYQERKKLEEKSMQLNFYQELYIDKSQNLSAKHKNVNDEDEDGNEVAFNNFTKIAGSGLDPIMNKIVKEGEDSVIQNFKEKIISLNQELRELSLRVDNINKIEKEKKESKILLDPNIKLQKKNLINKNENIENRERALIEELDSSQAFYRNSIMKLKQRIEEMDKLIAKELKFSKRNVYYNNRREQEY